MKRVFILIILGLYFGLVACGSSAVNSVATKSDESLNEDGCVTHANDYTYFVETGLNNDGRLTGLHFSTDLYKIGDSVDARAQMLYSAPSLVADHSEETPCSSLSFLYVYDDRLYFIETAPDSTAVLSWIPLEGVTQEANRVVKFETGAYEKVFYDDKYLYVLCNNGIQAVNLETNSIETLQLKFDSSIYVPELIYKGYIYCLYNENAIYRAKISGGKEKLFYKPEDEKDILTGSFAALSDTLYYMSFDGDTCAVSIDSLHTWAFPHRWYTVAADSDFLYLVDDFGDDGLIHILGHDGIETNTVTLIGEEVNRYDIAIGGEWLFVKTDTETSNAYNVSDLYKRVHLPDFTEEDETMVDFSDPGYERIEEGEWAGYAYPNFAYIDIYDGKESVIHIPATVNGHTINAFFFTFHYIHGLSGSSDSRFSDNDPYYADEIFLPETIKVFDLGAADSARVIHVPASVELVINTSNYSSNPQHLEALYYDGKIEEWLQMEEYGNLLGYGKQMGENRAYVVYCSDGNIS